MNQLFSDYLQRLQDFHRQFKEAINGLPQEALDWVPGDDMNSLCVLIIHTTGSARFWVGDVAIGETSNRDRDTEFQAHGLDQSMLKARLDETENYIRSALERLSFNDFERVVPDPRSDAETHEITIGWALLHALEHTALHLGHAQITRQLWDQGVRSA